MASVAKRKWKKPDGSTGEAWAVRYLDPATGKRPAKTFDLKKDAEAFKRKVEREIEDGVHVDRASSRKISDVIDEFIRDAELRHRDGRIGLGHCKRLTQVCYARHVPALGGVLARDLTMTQAADHYRAMVATGVHPRTAKVYLGVLGKVESFARRRGYMKTQPVADAMTELRGLPAYDMATFQPEEVARLLREAPVVMKGRPLRTAAFIGCAVALAALLGLRAGEITGLHTANVDFDRKVVRVRHSLTIYRELKGPKTAAGRRDVPIPAPALDLLIRWRDRFLIPNDDGLFFTTGTGCAFSYGALHMSWRRLLDRHDIPVRNFHALRHFYASWLIRHGMPIADVSKMIGHASHEMTLRVYTHALMEHQDAASTVDRIAALLPSATASMTHRAVTA